MQKKPNILFFLSDSHRFDWLGSNDDLPLRTPTLNSLKESGVGFENAICPAPLCAPSRASLASGMSFNRCGVPDNYTNYPLGDYLDSQPTYYQRLRDEAGYHVMGCGKFDLQKAIFHWGKDGSYITQELGFSDAIDNADSTLANLHVNDVVRSDERHDPYIEYLRGQDLLELHLDDYAKRRTLEETSPTPLPQEAYIDNWIARNGLKLLRNAPQNCPWHLVVNFNGPHPPFAVTEDMYEWYRGEDSAQFPSPIARNGDESSRSSPITSDEKLSPETHTEIRRNYAAMIENIDKQIAKYLHELEERNERENTIVVYASDHGEMLGDHELFYKKSPYHQSLGVPLIVSGPDIQGRGSVDVPVGLLDLHATFLEYAEVPIDVGQEPAMPSLGCSNPGSGSRSGIDSVSLKDYLQGEKASHRKYICAGLDGCCRGISETMKIIYDGRYKVVEGWEQAEHHGEPSPVLFDHKTDPTERTNVADDNADVVAELRDKLDDWYTN